MARRKAPRCKPDHNKVCFRDEIAAKIALAKQRDNNDRMEIPRRAYPCNFGKHYHLTSREARRTDVKQGKAQAGVKGEENATRIARVAATQRKAPGEGKGDAGSSAYPEGHGT